MIFANTLLALPIFTTPRMRRESLSIMQARGVLVRFIEASNNAAFAEVNDCAKACASLAFTNRFKQDIANCQFSFYVAVILREIKTALPRENVGASFSHVIVFPLHSEIISDHPRRAPFDAILCVCPSCFSGSDHSTP